MRRYNAAPHTVTYPAYSLGEAVYLFGHIQLAVAVEVAFYYCFVAFHRDHSFY